MSEIKHGDYPFIGYTAFLCLIAMTALASRDFFRWRYIGFGVLYLIMSTCIIALMLSSASSVFHQCLYIVTVIGVAVIYFADIHWNDNFTHLFLYVNIWISGAVGTFLWGYEFGQKYLILCFQGILIYHYASCSPSTDDDDALGPELLEEGEILDEEAVLFPNQA